MIHIFHGGIIARNNVDTRLLSKSFGHELIAHVAYRIGRGSQPCDTHVGHLFGEFGIFTHETIYNNTMEILFVRCITRYTVCLTRWIRTSWMNSLRARRANGAKNLFRIEVGLIGCRRSNANGFICHFDKGSMGISGGINGHCFNA